jgi:hypothetical protein
MPKGSSPVSRNTGRPVSPHGPKSEWLPLDYSAYLGWRLMKAAIPGTVNAMTPCSGA